MSILNYYLVKDVKSVLISLGLIVVGVFWLVHYSLSKSPNTNKIKVGVVLPVEHDAINSIARGLIKELSDEKWKDRISLSVKNGLADLGTMQSIVEGYLYDDVDVLIPIGTAPSQICAKLTTKVPIVSVAGDIQDIKQDNLAAVLNLENEEKVFDMICDIIPNLKKLSIICAVRDVFIEQSNQIKKLADKKGVQVNVLFINNSSEMYQLASHIPSDTQLLLVLKDNLVLSALPLLVSYANEHKIPFFCTSQSCLEYGGTCSLCTTEEDLGRHGGALAKKIIEGQRPSDLGYIDLRNELQVFLNEAACKRHNLSIDLVGKYAKKNNLEIVKIKEHQ